MRKTVGGTSSAWSPWTIKLLGLMSRWTKCRSCSDLTAESWTCARAFNKTIFLNGYHEHTIWEAQKNAFPLLGLCSSIKSPSDLPRYSRTMTSYRSSLPYQSTGQVPVQPAILVYTWYS